MLYHSFTYINWFNSCSIIILIFTDVEIEANEIT